MHSLFLIHYQSTPTIDYTNMNMAAAPLPTTTTFEPSSDLIREEDCNTLLLYLPGFTKEQLKVQLTRTRDLKISGVRQLENNKLSSFQKDFHVPENCDTNKISAKFEDGILYIRQPKYPQQTPPPQTPHPPPPQTPHPPPHKPANQPPHRPADQPPRKPADQPPRKLADKPLTARPPTPKKIDEIKQTIAKESVDQSKETKKPSGKTSESEIGKKEDNRKHAEEKTGGGAAAAEEKKDKGAVSNRVEEDYKKLNEGSPAARLKAARKQIANALLLMFVFGLGIYVAKLPWFSRTEKP